jgi:hypothetical protein
MRSVREVAPLGIVVVIIGAVTWALISGHEAIGSWLLAGLILAHGLIHVMFLTPAPPRTAMADGPAWPFDLGDSWLVDRAGGGAVAITGRILVVAIVGCALLAALAIVGVLVPSALWAPLVVGTAVCSLLLLGVAFSPRLVVGIAIDMALVWLAVASAWAPV